MKALAVPVLFLAAAATCPAQETPVIELFVGTDDPVTGLGATGGYPVTIYRVDALHALIRRLAAELPADPTEEPRRLRATLAALMPDDRDALRQATAGLLRARHRYGLDRYPALVLDGRAVVYGVTDLEEALALYRDWREGEGESTGEAAP